MQTKYFIWRSLMFPQLYEVWVVDGKHGKYKSSDQDHWTSCSSLYKNINNVSFMEENKEWLREITEEEAALLL